MVHFHEVAGQIAGVIFLSAFVLYFVQTIRGQMSPNRMTWLIWTLLGVLILASYKSVGAENTIWLAVAGAIGPFAILILTIWFGERGTSKLDIACLAGACVGLIGWWLTTNAFVGLVLFIAADCMGFIPTAVKIWRDPKKRIIACSDTLVPWQYVSVYGP